MLKISHDKVLNNNSSHVPAKENSLLVEHVRKIRSTSYPKKDL